MGRSDKAAGYQVKGNWYVRSIHAFNTIGAVGSSGSTQETDDACAKAGIAKVDELLK
jgi:uncharacterized protein GlcG (DUF336 family)